VAIATTLRECGLAADTKPLREVLTLVGYSAIVVGAPLFMFRWYKDALRFLSRHREALTERPVAVFALGPTHDPYDEKEWQDSLTQLNKALTKALVVCPE
jgi:menaquinone-dependent protoporphyrinogen oxidase